MDLLDKIREILNKYCQTGFKSHDINESVLLIDDLGYDSLIFVRILVEIEILLDITIDDEALIIENMETIGDLLRQIEIALGDSQC